MKRDTLSRIAPTEIIAVQALDGRWNYGPAILEAALRSEEFGVYPDAPTAWRAGQQESGKVPT